jgi:hypothetical protein
MYIRIIHYKLYIKKTLLSIGTYCFETSSKFQIKTMFTQCKAMSRSVQFEE